MRDDNNDYRSIMEKDNLGDIKFCVCGLSASGTVLKKPKSHYLSMNARQFVISKVMKHFPQIATIDYDRLWIDLRVLQIIKDVPIQMFANDNGRHFVVNLINKKRLHAYLKRNKNRYLLKAYKAQRDHDSFMFSSTDYDY